MEQIQSFCRILQEKIALSPNGHLPLSDRVKLMRLVEEPILINKIMFECAKKVYAIWQKDYPDDTIFADILHKCHEYLYQSRYDKKYFRSLADDNRNYAEAEGNNSNDAAVSMIFLCGSIAGDAGSILKNSPDYDYDNSDDNEYEADEWTTDFYASLVFSDGSPFYNEGNIMKRKEFWIWYIDTALELLKYPDKSILPLPKMQLTKEIISNNLFTRTQIYNTTEILEKIDSIINLAINLINKESIKWKILILKSFNIQGNFAKIYYMERDNDEEKDLKKGNQDIIQTFVKIKKVMYQQKPEEGAWIQSYLTVYPNGEFEYKFNYDNYKSLENFANFPEWYFDEFKDYPRSKEFTPEWWQRIVGKKAKYLK